MENTNGDGKIRKVLFNEVALTLAIVGTASSFLLWIMGPQNLNITAIEILKSQVSAQEATIATVTKTQQNDTKEVKNEVAGLRAQIGSLEGQIIKLTTIIEERIPKK